MCNNQYFYIKIKTYLYKIYFIFKNYYLTLFDSADIRLRLTSITFNFIFNQYQLPSTSISINFKKEVRDEAPFLHVHKHQSFFKLALLVLMEVARHVQSIPNII